MIVQHRPNRVAMVVHAEWKSEYLSKIRQWFDFFQMQKVDFLVVGGGIVGVAVARHLQMTFSQMKCLLVEKENGLGKRRGGTPIAQADHRPV